MLGKDEDREGPRKAETDLGENQCESSHVESTEDHKAFDGEIRTNGMQPGLTAPLPGWGRAHVTCEGTRRCCRPLKK